MDKTVPAVERHPLVRQSQKKWDEAVQPVFLKEAAKGRLPQAVFDRWFVQQYHFILRFCSFFSVCLDKAPREDWPVLLRGTGRLEEETDWFEQQAVARHLDLGEPLHFVTRTYTDFLLWSASRKTYAVLAAVVFAVVVSSLAAWRRLPQTGPYREFIRRWSDEVLWDYAGEVGEITQRYEDPGMLQAFHSILDYQNLFWRMALEGEDRKEV